MAIHSYLTVGDVARLYGVAQWRIRKIVDGLDADIPRAGLYRMIPRDLLDVIATELDQRGWLPAETHSSSRTGA